MTICHFLDGKEDKDCAKIIISIILKNDILLINQSWTNYDEKSEQFQ